MGSNTRAGAILKRIREKRAAWTERLRYWSIRQAVGEQKLGGQVEILRRLEPDISRQYTNFRIDSDYLELKVRAQHAFQMQMFTEALTALGPGPGEETLVVDIGDSSGTHCRYIKGMFKNVRTLSVNLDPQAVEKILAKGLEALNARAEDLAEYNLKPDFFISFETLEHLSDPIRFLYGISQNMNCRAFVLTVPYVKVSRVGLNHIRIGQRKDLNAEGAHIFELCPEDWRLLFLHAGWRVHVDRVYRQYPRRRPLALSRRIWRRSDFEGFYGAVLIPDHTWSRLYGDW